MKPASTGAAAGNANRFRLHSVACALCLCSLCTYVSLGVFIYLYIIQVYVRMTSFRICVWKFIKLLIVQTSCTHAYDVFLALPCLYFQFHQIALENWPHHILPHLLLHFLLHLLFIPLLSWNCFASGQHVCSLRAQDEMRSAYGGQETILRTWTKSCPRCAANRSLDL